MRILLEVAGQTQIDRELLRLGSRAVDAEPAFVAIGKLLIQETKVQFDTEGHHASGGWKPLAPATVAAKRSGSYRPQILQRTGALLDSLTVPDDANMVFKASPDELVYGTRLPYGVLHQLGTRRMPRRRPLEFTEETKRAVVKILQGWFFDGRLPA